jgi:hypothetical protein
VGHIFHQHFDKVLLLGMEGHLNTLTAHMFAFIREFDLLDKRECLPLQELFDEFELTDRI